MTETITMPAQIFEDILTCCKVMTQLHGNLLGKVGIEGLPEGHLERLRYVERLTLQVANRMKDLNKH